MKTAVAKGISWGSKCAAIVAALALSLAPGVLAPASAAPQIPDIDSLIDDTGPLETKVVETKGARSILFGTPSGLLCAQTTIKIADRVLCGGSELPGLTGGAHVAVLMTAYEKGLGAATFEGKPIDEFLGDTSDAEPIVLAPGHKIVFWNSDGEALMCGVPAGVEMACVVKTLQDMGRPGKVAHGFVIAAPKSWVF